jgi:hypothetical protein
MTHDLYPLCSTLEWKLGIHLSEWRAARELQYRRSGKLHPELEAAHLNGVVRLLREHLEAINEA